jgi:DNA-binding transcriptional LysR family regulator
MLPPLIERLSRVHPRLVLHVDQVNTPDMQFPELRERKLDVVLARLPRSLTAENFDDDLKAEILFNDRLLVVAGTQSPWARRRKVTLADLVNEPWVTAPPNTFYSHVLTEAFRACGLAMPSSSVTTFSMHVRTNLASSGRFIVTLPSSVLPFNAKRFSLKALPIELPKRPWPVALVALKHRTLSPVVERFIAHVRDFVRPMGESG